MKLQDCAVVLECRETSIQIMWHRRPWTVNRPPSLNVEPADWVAFDFDQDSQQPVNLSKLSKRRWNSRLDADYNMLFTVNATVRDPEEYKWNVDAKCPWSFELEWLEDPSGRMTTARQVYPGVMYEVTVRIKRRELAAGALKQFEVVSVDDESPPQMQIQVVESPWVADTASKATKARGGDQSLINREPGRINRATIYQGIIYRSVVGGNERGGAFRPDLLTFFVWSMETGVLQVVDRPDYVSGFMVGEWVKFESTRHLGKIGAHKLRRARTDPRKTDSTSTGHHNGVTLALVLLRVPVPLVLEDRRCITTVDEYLGTIEFRSTALNRQLEMHTYTLDDVKGKVLLVWVKPGRSVGGQVTWELSSIDPDVVEEDDTDVDALGHDLIEL